MPNDRLTSFRLHKDEHYRNDTDSPIDAVEQQTFTGLEYYPEDESLVVEQELDTSIDSLGEQVDMPTSDGGEKHFLRAGAIHLVVDGEEVQLTVFTEMDRGRYFLPFKDATNGVETYIDGRYLDPRRLPDGKLTVDFNYAYNPYCAYSDGWSCPYPPDENHLAVALRAGEKGRVRGVTDAKS